MEVVGLVLGVAGIFSICVDVLEKVDAYRDFDITSRQLSVRFETEKSKLKEWASAVGIRGNTLLKQHHPRLDDKHVCPLVERILHTTQELFSKTNHLSDKLFRSSTKRNREPQAFQQELVNANDLKLDLRISTRNKLKGLLGDESRFRQNVESLEVLVQNLYTLVPPKQDASNEELLESLAITADQNQEMLRALQLVDDNLQNLMIDNRRRNEFEELRLIAEILDVPKFSDTLSNQLNTRLEGTCDWIFQNSVYREWLASDSTISNARFLWLYGPAGFGKTILCSRIVETLRQTYSPWVFHFFSSLHVQSGGKPDGIINLWLSEIAAVNQVSRNLVLANLNPKSLVRGLSSADLWEAFRATVLYLDNAVFVLDGIDEYEHNDDRTSFLNNLKINLIQTSSRVLIMSRDEPDIRAELDPSGITVTSSNHLYSYGIDRGDTFLDLSLYSDSIVEQKLGKKETSFKQELAQSLTKRSEGMFLWVSLSGKALRSSMPKMQLKRIVETAPKGLDSAYEKNWKDIVNQDDYAKARGLRILQWSMFAFRPLTVGELAVGLMVQILDPDDTFELDELRESIDDNYIDKEVVSLCASLVDIKFSSPADLPEFRVVQLKHASVKEFLSLKMPQCIGTEFDFNLISESSHHLELAKVCLRFLCYDLINPDDLCETSMIQIVSFRDYALRNWVEHSHKANMDDIDLQHLIIKFLQSKSYSFHSWALWFEFPSSSSIDAKHSEHTPASSIYYAALLGNMVVFRQLYEMHTFDLNNSGGRFGTPLQATCVNGNTMLVKTLLEYGVDIDICTGELGTALCTAAWYGQLEIVECLLAHNATIDQKGVAGRSPLYCSADAGHIEVARLLLKQGANVDSLTDRGNTPLSIAASRGHLNVVDILLSSGANPLHRTADGFTVLYCAAANGRVDILRNLVTSYTDLDIPDKLGRTPLMSAVINGHIDTVHLLLDRGANIDSLSIDGWTPLHLAVLFKRPTIVELLMKEGANPSPLDYNGYTPLHIAAYNGELELVKSLTKSGLNLDCLSKNALSPLYWAITRDHLEVAEFLAKAGADIDIRNKVGWTPLLVAAARGRTNMVELLLQSGANLDLSSTSGETALMHAVSYEHFEIAQLLWNHLTSSNSSNISCRQSQNYTRSAQEAHGVEEPLLAQDTTAVVAESEQKARQTRLTAQEHLALVDCEGRSILHRAAASGNVTVLDLFLKDEMAVPAADRLGRTLLDHACLSASTEMVKRLLTDPIKHFQGVNSFTSWSPLHWACQKGSIEILELLYGAGHRFSVVMTSQPTCLWSPLDIASYFNNTNILDANDILVKHPFWKTIDENEFIKFDSASGIAHAVRQNSYVAVTGNPKIWCDGCLKKLVGIRFQCKTCINIDYCFMCKLDADAYHVQHGWAIHQAGPGELIERVGSAADSVS